MPPNVRAIVKTFRAPCSFVVKGLPENFSVEDQVMRSKLEEFFVMTSNNLHLQINGITMVQNTQTRYAVVQFKTFSKNLRKQVAFFHEKEFEGKKLKITPFFYPNKDLHPEFFKN
ncbi:predicted protein [Naegleria gruberi]|uniref:Predicted protein n=1 Tax=Naegleria gruberi TaxID=5762 RepID=D2V5D4_NAEGR|nr:uncharacterized protein NAEGRDRAFT_63782 [Naegleria gruberi]EFC48092.1 predicted protein [Naegleria gruberi]|eukprot:XP_002680836.1 predicted protein [Naegleria gruberi strain NEG-M]